jgi:hypothetical protein
MAHRKSTQKMKKATPLLLGFALLLTTEILRVYFIMPFPGSQHSNSIGLAYFLDKYIIWFRIIGFILVVPSAWYYFKNGRFWQKGLLTVFILLYAFIGYMFNFRFLADKMFYQPTNKRMALVADNQVDTNKLIIGAFINGEASAYPIQIIGYHHQVQDTIGGDPAIITYCTVCRTGRIFSPVVLDQYQRFRLVGMDHFNAMLEDESTKSWWRQATGVAIAGPLKGTRLKELPSAQMRLGAWIRLHPQTRILQPDTLYTAEYADLEGYDSGTLKGSLEKRDSASWKSKSWVIGVVQNGNAKAYDWNRLVHQGSISDTVGTLPVLIVLENDSVTFHAWSRSLDGKVLQFQWVDSLKSWSDANTGSLWSVDGLALNGPLAGKRLEPVQAYQEFWHSWRTFHPSTTLYQ